MGPDIVDTLVHFGYTECCGTDSMDSIGRECAPYCRPTAAIAMPPARNADWIIVDERMLE